MFKHERFVSDRIFYGDNFVSIQARTTIFKLLINFPKQLFVSFTSSHIV